MMRQIHIDSGRSLLDVFSVNVCGRDLPQGKPDPAIFLLAAAEMRVAPAHCFVVEDAPAGVISAKAAGCPVIGVLTTHTALDAPSVTSLDQVTFTPVDGGIEVSILG